MTTQMRPLERDPLYLLWDLWVFEHAEQTEHCNGVLPTKLGTRTFGLLAT
jgi:hypothetical protein